MLDRVAESWYVTVPWPVAIYDGLVASSIRLDRSVALEVRHCALARIDDRIRCNKTLGLAASRRDMGDVGDPVRCVGSNPGWRRACAS
jgi:hypothetical protein